MKYTVCFVKILKGKAEIEAKNAQQASQLVTEKDIWWEVKSTYQDRIIREDGLDCLGSDNETKN